MYEELQYELKTIQSVRGPFLSSFYEINNVCENIKTVYQNVEHQVQWHPEYYGTHHISCMLIVSYKLLVTLLNFSVNAMSG